MCKLRISFLLLGLLCLCSAFRKHQYSKVKGRDVLQSDTSIKGENASIEGRNVASTSCSGDVIFDAHGPGPCRGFDTLDSVRRGLWKAWEKCNKIEGLSGRFLAVNYGHEETPKKQDFKGQMVTMNVKIEEFSMKGQLRFQAEALPAPPKRGGIVSFAFDQFAENMLPETFSSYASNLKKITNTELDFEGKTPNGRLVSDASAETQTFLEHLSACAALNWHGMLPSRERVPKAATISNLGDWVYGVANGRARGMGVEDVAMKVAEEEAVVDAPWADFGLRLIPEMQPELPFWLWGNPANEQHNWWPDALSLEHILKKFDGYCRSESSSDMPCQSYMIAVEGTSEKGEPLTIVVYADLMHLGSENASTAVPALIIKRGYGEETELFKIGFTTGLRDFSTTEHGVKQTYHALDSTVLVQRPGGNEFIQDECILTVLIDLQAKRVNIQLQPSPSEQKHMGSQLICDVDETLPKERLKRFNVLGWM